MGRGKGEDVKRAPSRVQWDFHARCEKPINLLRSNPERLPSEQPTCCPWSAVIL